MKTDRLTIVAVALITFAALVGAVVLQALGYQVPDLLPFVVTTGLGVLGGTAVPRSSTASTEDDGPGTGGPASGSRVPTALVRQDTGELLHPRRAA